MTVPVARNVVLGRPDVDDRLVEDRRRHLRGDETLPNQRVEPQLVALEVSGETLRRALHRGRTDRFVRVLRAFANAVNAAAVELFAVGRRR